MGLLTIVSRGGSVDGRINHDRHALLMRTGANCMVIDRGWLNCGATFITAVHAYGYQGYGFG